MYLDLQVPNYSFLPNIRLSSFAYYYQSVIVISLSLPLSDSIKQPSLSWNSYFYKNIIIGGIIVNFIPMELKISLKFLISFSWSYPVLQNYTRCQLKIKLITFKRFYQTKKIRLNHVLSHFHGHVQFPRI